MKDIEGCVILIKLNRAYNPFTHWYSLLVSTYTLSVMIEWPPVFIQPSSSILVYGRLRIRHRTTSPAYFLLICLYKMVAAPKEHPKQCTSPLEYTVVYGYCVARSLPEWEESALAYNRFYISPPTVKQNSDPD